MHRFLLIVIVIWRKSKKVKVSPLQTIKAYGDVDTMIHIFAATALGRVRVASPGDGNQMMHLQQIATI